MKDQPEIAPVSADDFGLYVHFPYCLRICPYCDFNVYAGSFDGEAYANAVMAEIAVRGVSYASYGSLRSIYFGGGTPSLWESKQISRVIEFADSMFGIRSDAEITLECNPEKLDETRLETMRKAGINRVSLGAQSLSKQELVQLGRLHGPDEVFKAIQLCKQFDFTTSVDIIFGVPGQSSTALEQTLDQILLEPIEHISTYALTIEPGTHFDKQVKRGKLRPMSGDDQADRMSELCERIVQAGFEHYEVSAFARDEFRAIHNSLYWVGAPFLGVGAGAHSFQPQTEDTPAMRRESLRNPDTYISSADREIFPAEFEETLTPRQFATEMLMVGSRVKWGVNLRDLPWGSSAPEKMRQLEPVIAQLCSEGLLQHDQDIIWPTELGLRFADTIALKLVETASELIG